MQIIENQQECSKEHVEFVVRKDTNHLNVGKIIETKTRAHHGIKLKMRGKLKKLRIHLRKIINQQIRDIIVIIARKTGKQKIDALRRKQIKKSPKQSQLMLC